MSFTHSLEQFTHSFERECIAIAPALYSKAIAIVSDLEIGPDGEPQTPIHDALNWRYTRFGHQVKPTFYAALFLNEDGSTWQAKLSDPLLDREKGTLRKYEAPVGNGSRAYLPPVNRETRRAIARRYNCEVPPPGASFWVWLEQHPEIPIVITEGGKKGLSLLSQGYVAIALYGVNGGYTKFQTLIPDIARFAAAGRPVTLAFDQDSEAKTRRKVSVALSRFGWLLSAAGCDVAIAQWDGRQGKGIDDLIAAAGAGAAEKAIDEALPLDYWRHWQRLGNVLTWAPALKVNMPSLESLDIRGIPETGIIAIAAPKATGKTKLLAKLIAGVEKVLCPGHRITLQRNLAARLGIDYRGDIDKTPDGRFINGAGYTLRIGLCVESLLSINPQHFEGCDLVIDEVVQVLRQLLTSSTCQRDGMRPALLARFTELVRAARRVIVADADLDNATLSYLKALRGHDSPVWLLRNDYQAQGFPVRFIESPDSSAIKAELLADCLSLKPGRVLFIATDSKGTTKEIARVLAQECPDKRVLVINSETSGGDAEQEFSTTPDIVLRRGDYDIIIASPSLSTGASIESTGIIQRVYGIYNGDAGPDGDAGQSLIRVREPVERVVWCAKTGRNFNRISRSQNPLEIKNILLSRTSATVSLIRSSLKADVASATAAYNWQSDPSFSLYAHFAAQQNRAMSSFRTALLVRLRHEGHQVTIEQRDRDQAFGLLLAEARQAVKTLDAEAIANADDLTFVEVKRLEQSEHCTPEQQRAIERFYLKDFYCLESVIVDDVLADNTGRRRAELRSLEESVYPNVAADRTVHRLEQQASWNQGLCPWDISGAALRRELREKIGLFDFLDPEKVWTADKLKPYGDRARELAPQIKALLHFTITEEMSDTQIIHQLLRQLGVKVSWRWKGSSHNGTRRRVYSLDRDHWDSSMEILERRQAKRLELQSTDEEIGSPLPENEVISTGDPIPQTPLKPGMSVLTPYGMGIISRIEDEGYRVESAEWFRWFSPNQVEVVAA